MTSLVRRYLKTSIAFLMVGIALGLWMMVQRESYGRASSAYVLSAHTHCILVGFMMLMIFGVALWMFPRPAKGDTRYRPALAEAAYWLVTLGTAARIVGELARAGGLTGAVIIVVLVGGVAQAVGISLFFANLWPRIRAVGSQGREAAGERF
jgi:heme/copper-type cytochrome/quinol oxidase subunit 1